MHLLPNNLGTLADVTGDHTKYSCDAVHVRLHGDGTYRVAATDTKKLIMVNGPVVDDAANFPEIPALIASPNGGTESLVMAKTWKSVFQAAKKIKSRTKPILNSVATVIGDNVTSFAATDLDRVVFEQPRNMDGRFPDVASVVPVEAKAVAAVKVDLSNLRELCAALMPFTDDTSYHSTKLEIHKNNCLALRGERPDGQKFVSVLMCLTPEKKSDDGDSDTIDKSNTETDNRIEELQAKIEALEAEKAELIADKARYQEILEAREVRISELNRPTSITLIANTNRRERLARKEIA